VLRYVKAFLANANVSDTILTMVVVENKDVLLFRTVAQNVVE
jgi:hypothetical protein